SCATHACMFDVDPTEGDPDFVLARDYNPETYPEGRCAPTCATDEECGDGLVCGDVFLEDGTTALGCVAEPEPGSGGATDSGGGASDGSPPSPPFTEIRAEDDGDGCAYANHPSTKYGWSVLLGLGLALRQRRRR
ncbi:MAG: MYXO-CTERM sorting domain-containing protein, partial [Myxococcota bacterium]